MRPVQDIAMHEGGAAVAGVALRALWGKQPGFGWLGTAGLLAAGLFGDAFIRDRNMRRALEGVSAGSAAILAWAASEKFIFGNTGVPIPARYGQGAFSNRPQPALYGGGARGGVPMINPIPENARRY